MENSNLKSVSLYKEQYKLQRKGERTYRLNGIMIFTIACALLVVRTVVYYLSSFITDDTVLEAIFSFTLQLGVLVGVPVCFCIFAHKMTFKQMLSYSNFKKTKWFNYVFAVLIGLMVMFVTQGISMIWQMIIASLGYTHSAADSLPQNFSVGLFILSLITTAVLPGFCEEVAVRGGYLTTMRKSFSYKRTLIIMGITFGLFHQYITQVFYTACFGVLVAMIVLKSKSIYPAMIIHFLNNGLSVYLDYASQYGWWGGNYFTNLNIAITDSPSRVFAAYLLICGIFASLVAMFLYANSAQRLKKKKELIQDSGFDLTNKRVVLIGEENKELVKELDMDKEVYGTTLEEDLFKPSLKDNAFYIGAIVVASLTTIFTFIWGFIV